MIKLRAYLFSIIFMAGTLLLCMVTSPLLLFPSRKLVMTVPHIWANSTMWLLKNLVGLTYEIRGGENVPQGPCIIACKHQSAFETCVFHQIFHNTSYVFKKSLGFIPFVGWYISRSGSISVDRSSGSVAMRSILEGAKKMTGEGFKVVLFPEGTRTAVGQKTEYNPGIAFLYDKLRDVPVVPAAINSGLFWPRYSFLKLPGKIIIEFLPPIEKGLNKREFMNQLEERIETATAKLIKIVYNKEN